MPNATRPRISGFVDPKSAQDWARKRRASVLAQRRDHLADVLDGEAQPGVIAAGAGMLPHERLDDAGRGAAGTDVVDLQNKEGESHA